MENKELKKEESYEELVEKLKGILAIMEKTTSTLEEQLSSYEKGMKLITKINGILKDAEDRITIINKAGEEESFE